MTRHIAMMVGEQPGEYTLPVVRSKLSSMKASGVGTANIVVLGASVSEGTAASTHANTYVEKMAEKIRTSIGYPSSPNTRFVTSNYITSVGEVWTYSGATSTPETVLGYGARSRYLGVGSIATLAFTGIGIDVYFGRYTLTGNSTGTGTYAVDGGTPVAFSTNYAAPYGRIASDALISLRGLSAGAHTIVITCDSANIVVLEGAFVFGNDASNAVRVWDASHAGYGAYYYQRDDGDYCGNVNHLINTAADLVFVQFGGNDYFSDFQIVNFDMHLRRIIWQSRQTHPRCDIVLIKPHSMLFYANSSDSDFSHWRAVIQTVGNDLNCEVWDWEDALGSFAAPGNPYDSGDQIHPNDAGHEALAEFMFSKIVQNVSASDSGHSANIRPALDYQADGLNLLTNLDMTTWTFRSTPVITLPGGSIDGYTIYRIQDNTGSTTEGVLGPMPTLLKNRRYRMTVHFNVTDWAATSGDPRPTLLLWHPSNLTDGVYSSLNIADLKHIYAPFGAAIGLKVNSLGLYEFVGSIRPSPFDVTNWSILSLDFTVGSSDMVGNRFGVQPATVAASIQATVSFARPTLQLLSQHE